MLSTESPYASYQTMLRWLCTLNERPQIQRPVGDIIITIDNNQVLKKKCGIKVDNKCYSSIITMVVAFEICQIRCIEENSNLGPTAWRNLALTSEQILKLIQVDQDDEVKRVHYDHLFQYLSERIVKVVAEQRESDQGWVDFVDDKVSDDQHRAAHKICPECGHQKKKKDQ